MSLISLGTGVCGSGGLVVLCGRVVVTSSPIVSSVVMAAADEVTAPFGSMNAISLDMSDQYRQFCAPFSLFSCLSSGDFLEVGLVVVEVDSAVAPTEGERLWLFSTLLD